MRMLLYPFLVLSAAGFVLSVGVHLAAWAGLEPPPIAMALTIGVVVVWVPAMVAAKRLAWDVKEGKWWEAIDRAVPSWVVTATKWLGLYAFLNSAILLFLLAKEGAAEEVDNFRGFSGYWIFGYGAAFGILYSALHGKGADSFRMCPNGHPTSLTAIYCEQCGEPVSEPPRST